MKNAILPVLSLILFSEFLCAFEADYIPNKKLADKTIVFVLRKQYPPDHHNTGNIFQRDEVNTGSFLKCAGNSKLVAATFDGEGKIKSERILASAEKGLIRDAEISYDASSIVFAMRNSSAENYKIYERHKGRKNKAPYKSRLRVGHRTRLSADRRNSFQLDPRPEILRLQQTHNGKSLPHEFRRLQHYANREFNRI